MNSRATIIFTTLILFAALFVIAARADDETPTPEPKAKNPTVETPGAGDNPTVETLDAEKELDALVKNFVEGDEAAIKAAREALVGKGEAAVDRLFALKASEDEALAKRTVALLKEMGMSDDDVYAQMALYRLDFQPGELIGVRIIVKNYQKNTITVFCPSEGLKPGYGLKLQLHDAASGKAIGNVDLNAPIQANTGLAETAFVALKSGERYEDVLELRELFPKIQIPPGKYKITGAFSDKCAKTEYLTKVSPTKLNNFYPGEIAFRPLDFSISVSVAATATPAQVTIIKRLIEELGDNSYKVRINAEIELEKMGVVVLPYLRDARENHKDLQVRETAYKIIQVLDVTSKQQNTYIGINLQGSNKGVGVSIVEKNSPADKGGMLVGDVVIKVDGEDIVGATENDRNNNLIKRIRYRKVGESVTFTVLRDGKEVDLTIVLGARSN